METRVHFTRKHEFPLSRAKSEIPVVLVDDERNIVEEGWYWMKGSREYLVRLTSLHGRTRKGEYWYLVAYKAGQRFARQFIKYGTKCFRLPDSFVNKIERDIFLYTGKAEGILWREFKHGFRAQIHIDDPALYARIFDAENDEERGIFVSKTVTHLCGYTLIFADISRHEKPCVIELLSELSKTERLINHPQPIIG